MRKTSLAVAMVLLSLTAACGDDDDATNSDTASVEQETPSEDTSAAGGGGGTVLTGVVGEEGDPDAFTIKLMDDAGKEVTTLPAGDYTVKVQDLSSIHNFHWKGPDVDESTTVPEIGDATWEVTLAAGEHTMVCDPHPKMKTSITVT